MTPGKQWFSRSSRTIFFLAPIALLLLAYSANIFGASKSSAAPALGATDFRPSPAQPIGWRGDGSGRYPGAVGPVAWERKSGPDGYTTKGIVWMTPLPNIGVACPIIVGDRIFLTSEVCDLVCLDKQSGRLMWIRSNTEFEGLSDEDRQSGLRGKIGAPAS
jgi:hypothetical protein